MTNKMTAAQYISPGIIDLIESPIPICTPQQVLVRMEKLTICGSDIQALYGSQPTDYPFAPGMTGHECVGIVEESAFPEIKPGHRMLVIPPEANAMAEYIAIEPRWLIPLPEDLEPELAVLGQQLGTVIYCCKK